MKKYEGTPIVYEYWLDSQHNKVYAIVEWSEYDSDMKHSNLILMSKECNSDTKTI